MEKELHHSEPWFQALFEAAPEAMLVFDARSGRFESVNRAAVSLFGIGRKAFLGMTAADVTVDAPVREAARRGPTVRVFRTHGGAVFTGEVSEGGFTSEGRRKILWTIRHSHGPADGGEAMREGEIREYRSLVENIAIGVTLISTDMRVLTANKQMKRWYPAVDFSKQPICYHCFNDPPREDICTYCPVIKTLGDGRVHEAVTETPSGGSIRHFRIVASPVKGRDGSIRAAIEMVEDISAHMAAEQQIQNLSQQLLTAQENERLMISNELHDSVAQDLSTMKIALALLANDPSPLQGDARKSLASLAAIVNRTILTVRNLSYDLRPPGLKEIGLTETLLTYCDEFEEDTGIRVKFRSAGLKNKQMDPFLNINIYRLVQEGLNNIRRHADARRAVVRLIGAYPNVILRIEDDGKGFDVAARERAGFSEKRMGISSMRERVNLMMGQMTIQSRPGAGTRIVIRFPFRAAPDDRVP